MYMNTGYLKHSHMDFKDKSRPLIVGSCGIYRLSEHPKMPTYRPRGRVDFQIIYIAAGCGHFHFDTVDNETIPIDIVGYKSYNPIMFVGIIGFII